MCSLLLQDPALLAAAPMEANLKLNSQTYARRSVGERWTPDDTETFYQVRPICRTALVHWCSTDGACDSLLWTRRPRVTAQVRCGGWTSAAV